jgi:hypothetical protein
MAAFLTLSGRTVIATAIKARTAHMAWGSGNTGWGSTPPDPSVSDTALVAEVGRRKASQVEYVVADANGAIEVPQGKYSITSTPTVSLYFKFFFDFADGVGSTIRERAIFIDTVAASGVPAGQMYLLPNQVQSPGTLLVIERNAPIVREVTTRQLFEFVVTF